MRKLQSIGWPLVAAVFLGQGGLHAQETLMQGGLRHGGFGAPVVKFTQIDNKFGVLVGGRGGWIINNAFVIGGGGYALANQDNFEQAINGLGDRGRLGMGYGGLELEYVHHPNDLVHLSLVVLVGAGGLVWEPLSKSVRQEDDAFFITEPSLNALVNVTSFFRAGLGISYRFVRDVDLYDLRDQDISGFTGVVTLKFGSF